MTTNLRNVVDLTQVYSAAATPKELLEFVYICHQIENRVIVLETRFSVLDSDVFL